MKLSIFMFIVLVAVQSIWAVEKINVGNFKFLGGQYYFKSEPSSLSGNISLTITPSFKYSDKFSLIPSYFGSYKGTKEVTDLAGGGTLFQDGQTHLVSVKAVYGQNLKVKLNTGYRTEFLRETKDEGWGAGLFDYRKLNGGVEAQLQYSKLNNVRIGADYFSITFPNYTSLESKQQSSTSTLSRELAGAKTLNNDNIMVYVNNQSFIKKLIIDVSATSTSRNYPDQPVVLESGDLSSTKRVESSLQANVSLSYLVEPLEWLKILPSVGYGIITNDSSQNHFDAMKTKHIA
ncbi:MAG: hypothetical protein AB1633_09035, partial [Elusimicrobiota bacterium]